MLAPHAAPAFASALHAAGFDAPPASRADAAEARLVLFIGEALRPPPEVAHCLARDGVRSLWLGGTQQALRAGAMARFDAVLIDGAAMQGGAAATITRLRAALDCPLVVVAEEADEIDEIVALELGADLYLARPLAPRRLRAHLAALLRRRAPPAEAASDTPRYAEAGGWVLDTQAARLQRGSRQVALTEVQLQLLRQLLATPGQVVPRATLVAALPHGEQLSARCVDVYIHRLRQRLREQAVDGLEIEVVRGRGYVLGVAT